MPMPQFIAFTKVSLPFGWLGNMSPHPIQFEGRRWRTAEALFQALRFDAPTIREEIRAAKSPMAAKFIARKHKDQMVVVPRSAQDVANMELVLRMKLAQHPILQAELLKTGDRLIVEDSSSRHGESARFWGAAFVAGQWVGRISTGCTSSEPGCRNGWRDCAFLASAGRFRLSDTRLTLLAPIAPD